MANLINIKCDMKTFYSVEWDGDLIRWDLVEENEVTG